MGKEPHGLVSSCGNLVKWLDPMIASRTWMRAWLLPLRHRALLIRGLVLLGPMRLRLRRLHRVSSVRGSGSYPPPLWQPMGHDLFEVRHQGFPIEYIYHCNFLSKLQLTMNQKEHHHLFHYQQYYSLHHNKGKELNQVFQVYHSLVIYHNPNSCLCPMEYIFLKSLPFERSLLRNHIQHHHLFHYFLDYNQHHNMGRQLDYVSLKYHILAMYHNSNSCLCPMEHINLNGSLFMQLSSQWLPQVLYHYSLDYNQHHNMGMELIPLFSNGRNQVNYYNPSSYYRPMEDLRLFVPVQPFSLLFLLLQQFLVLSYFSCCSLHH